MRIPDDDGSDCALPQYTLLFYFYQSNFDCRSDSDPLGSGETPTLHNMNGLYSLYGYLEVGGL